MAFKEELKTLLSNPESGIKDPELDMNEDRNGKVAGFLISKSFTGMPQLDRQNLVWDYL